MKDQVHPLLLHYIKSGALRRKWKIWKQKKTYFSWTLDIACENIQNQNLPATTLLKMNTSKNAPKIISSGPLTLGSWKSPDSEKILGGGLLSKIFCS